MEFTAKAPSTFSFPAPVSDRSADHDAILVLSISDKRKLVMWEGRYVDPTSKGETYVAKAAASGAPSRPLYLKDPTSSHVGQALFEVEAGDLVATAGFSSQLPGKVAITVYQVITINSPVDSPTAVALLKSVYFNFSKGDRNECRAPDLINYSSDISKLQSLVNATVTGLLNPQEDRSVYAQGISRGAAQEPVEYQDYQGVISRSFRNLLRDPIRFMIGENQIITLEGEGAHFRSKPEEVSALEVVPGLTLQLSSFQQGSYDLSAYPEDGTRYIVPPIVAAVALRSDFYVVDIYKLTHSDQCVRSLRQYT